MSERSDYNEYIDEDYVPQKLNFEKIEFSGHVHAHIENREYRVIWGRGKLHAQWLTRHSRIMKHRCAYGVYKFTIGNPTSMEEGMKMCQDYEDSKWTVELYPERDYSSGVKKVEIEPYSGFELK